MELLSGLEEKCVPFHPNFSETTEEPEVLPGLLPNLLVNGSYGIAVGYTTNFPSHNLSEVIDGIIKVIQNPDATLKDIMKYIKAPDFPLGSLLVDDGNIEKLYTEGKASLTFLSKYTIEENSENKNPQIIFHEIPPTVNKPKLVEKIYEVCIDKKQVPRVVDIRDESNGEAGIRIVVELHKTAIVDIVLSELFKRTDLKKSNSYILRCIDDKIPKVLSLKEIIEKYIEFHKEVYISKYTNMLAKVNKKLHIQEGYKKILTNIDKAIDIIRKSDDDKVAKVKLKDEFDLTDEQAEVILDMKLRNITKLASKDIDTTIQEYKDKIATYTDIISNDNSLNNVLINDLKDLKKRLGDNRKTEIVHDVATQIVQSVEKDVMLVLTNKNNIKHYEVDTYEEMILKGYKEKSEIFLQSVKINTNDKVLLILNNCKYICLEFNDLLGNISSLIDKQTIKTIIPLTENNMKKIIFVMTKKGLIKKCFVEKIKYKKKSAPLMEIDEEDNVIKVDLIDNNENNVITVASQDGLIHRFFVNSFKETSAGGKGLSSMSLQDSNIVDFIISDKSNDENNQLIIYAINENNYMIKKIPLKEFLVKGRIAKGVKSINFTTKSPGEIYKIFITDKDFSIINNKGILQEIKLNSIKENTKATKGENIDYDVLYIK
jgi:DNA gyrase subunit A